MTFAIGSGSYRAPAPAAARNAVPLARSEDGEHEASLPDESFRLPQEPAPEVAAAASPAPEREEAALPASDVPVGDGAALTQALAALLALAADPSGGESAPSDREAEASVVEMAADAAPQAAGPASPVVVAPLAIAQDSDPAAPAGPAAQAVSAMGAGAVAGRLATSSEVAAATAEPVAPAEGAPNPAASALGIGASALGGSPAATEASPDASTASSATPGQASLAQGSPAIPPGSAAGASGASSVQEPQAQSPAVATSEAAAPAAEKSAQTIPDQVLPRSEPAVSHGGERLPDSLVAPSTAAGSAAGPAASTGTGAGAAPVITHVPLGAVAVEIGLKTLAGVNHFEIRLDPQELGGVEVRIAIEGGEVKAHLVVDRVETLNLLQREAKTLERAFEQAGLKPSEGGIDLSLRDPQGEGRGQGRHDERGLRREAGGERPDHRPARDEAPPPVTPILWRPARGVDLRI